MQSLDVTHVGFLALDGLLLLVSSFLDHKHDRGTKSSPSEVVLIIFDGPRAGDELAGAGQNARAKASRLTDFARTFTAEE